MQEWSVEHAPRVCRKFLVLALEQQFQLRGGEEADAARGPPDIISPTGLENCKTSQVMCENSTCIMDRSQRLLVIFHGRCCGWLMTVMMPSRFLWRWEARTPATTTRVWWSPNSTHHSQHWYTTPMKRVHIIPSPGETVLPDYCYPYFRVFQYLLCRIFRKRPSHFQPKNMPPHPTSSKFDPTYL